MTNEQILAKAIKKAIDNEWKPLYQFRHHQGLEEAESWEVTPWSISWLRAGCIKIQQSVESLIFNHDFAKALWGEETERFWECPLCNYRFEWYKHNESQQFCPEDGRKVKDVTKPRPVWEQNWADHLQQMVIADDSIQYLGENL